MTWPKVSIVIPSFNQGKFILRTIRSIQLQDYPGQIEIIVSDGGSTDETVDVLKSVQGVTWWSSKDRGFTDAVNKGFKVATGEIWAIQSSDDFYLQGAVRKAISALNNHPECVLVSGSEIHIDIEGKVVKTDIHDSRIIHFPKQIVFERYVAQHCTFFRREAFTKIGGTREAVDRCADFDLFYRMLHLGPGITFPDLFAVYQLHPLQRIKSQADKWVEAGLKTITDAENDPLLGNRFRLSSEEKEYFEVCLILHWHTTAGGEDGKAFATDFARKVIATDSKWSSRAQEHARNWLGLPRAIHDVPSRKPMASRVYERLLRDGAKETSKAILRKIRREFDFSSNHQQSGVKRPDIQRDVNLPDINWWVNAG